MVQKGSKNQFFEPETWDSYQTSVFVIDQRIWSQNCLKCTLKYPKWVQKGPKRIQKGPKSYFELETWDSHQTSISMIDRRIWTQNCLKCILRCLDFVKLLNCLHNIIIKRYLVPRKNLSSGFTHKNDFLGIDLNYLKMKFHKVLSNSLVRRAPDVTVFHTLKFNRQIRHFGPFSKYSKTKFYRFSHQF